MFVFISSNNQETYVMDKSIFTEKNNKPTEHELQVAIGNTFLPWKQLEQYVCLAYPAALGEWNFPGIKFGWSFRIKDRKRAIVYLLPRDGFFKVAMVFGEKATDAVLQSGVSETIKTSLKEARVYAEGRGLRLDISGEDDLQDIYTLVDIKLAH